jgi:hypothetical protein
MLEDSGFVKIDIGPPVDTFGGAGGESKARLFEVFGTRFLRTSRSSSHSHGLRCSPGHLWPGCAIEAEIRHALP